MSSGRKEKGGGRNNHKNAQHLLNFTTPTRTVSGPSSQFGSGSKKPHHYNDRVEDYHVRVTAQEAKRAYMLQNFQFVISTDAIDAGRLNPALEDSDTMPPWDSITHVIIHESFDDYVCPVCLDPPCATRMTACGHIFCFPCILRHMKQQKEKGAVQNCPMCQAVVVKNALKPTLCVPKGTVQPCSSATGFSLVHREKRSCVCLLGRAEECSKIVCQSTLAELRQQASRAYGGAPSYNVAITHRLLPNYGDDGAAFSRFQRETQDLVECVRMQHVMELQERYEGVKALPRPLLDDDEAEASALETCLEWLEKGYLSLRSASSFSSLSQQSSSVVVMTAESRQQQQQQPNGGNSSVSPPRKGDVSSSSGTLNRLVPNPTTSSSATEELPNEPIFYDLYRLSDGQEAYLHFLNVKMLKEDAIRRRQQQEQKDSEQKPISEAHAEAAATTTSTKQQHVRMPLAISAPILDVETVTQTLHTRNCFKPVAHVPLHSSFQLCFADLSQIVLQETMDAFKDAISGRQTRLAELQARDDAAAAQMERQAWERYKKQSSGEHGGATLQSYFPSATNAGGGAMTQDERQLSAEWGIGVSPDLGPSDGQSLLDLRNSPPLESAYGGDNNNSSSAPPPPLDLPPASASGAAQQQQRGAEDEQPNNTQQQQSSSFSWAEKIKKKTPSSSAQYGGWAGKKATNATTATRSTANNGGSSATDAMPLQRLVATEALLSAASAEKEKKTADQKDQEKKDAKKRKEASQVLDALFDSNSATSAGNKATIGNDSNASSAAPILFEVFTMNEDGAGAGGGGDGQERQRQHQQESGGGGGKKKGKGGKSAKVVSLTAGGLGSSK